MMLPGVAMVLAMFSGVIVAGREIRERARTGPAAEVRNRHLRREAALAEKIQLPSAESGKGAGPPAVAVAVPVAWPLPVAQAHVHVQHNA